VLQAVHVFFSSITDLIECLHSFVLCQHNFGNTVFCWLLDFLAALDFFFLFAKSLCLFSFFCFFPSVLSLFFFDLTTLSARLTLHTPPLLLSTTTMPLSYVSLVFFSSFQSLRFLAFRLCFSFAPPTPLYVYILPNLLSFFLSSILLLFFFLFLCLLLFFFPSRRCALLCGAFSVHVFFF